ncbi:MAG: tetratricopeptide repeat protein, partial [Ktedonobacteraceae bacterium]|nr:tetratricopeptide repeat protein [Ktedonobacteraceae bacterium]
MSKDALTILEALRDLSLEEGRIYIQQHSAEIEDVAGFGVRWKDEALRQRDIHPFTSLKLAEQLIYFGEYMHHDSSRALGLMAKGDALSAIGHEQAAMEAFDAAAEEFQRLGDEVNWARTRIGWIISCAWLGRVEEALQTAARARAIFEKHNLPYWVCVIDHNTAVIYTQAGQYQKALELYERMLTIYPTVTDMGEEWVKRAVAMVEMNQARNLAWLGDFGQAYRLLQQARESLDVLGQVNLVIKIEINLANLDYIQGYYGSALRRYYQIRDKVIQNKLNEIGMLAPIMLPMANCLVKLKRFQEACQLAAEAVDIYRRMSAAPLSIGNALYDYAATLIAAQRLKEAFAALHEAESFLSEGGFVHHATVAKLQQAELLLQMSFFREAYEQAARLKQHFEAQGLVARFTDACLIMANTLLSQFRQVDIFQEMQSSSMSREIKELCEQVADLAGQHKLREQAYKSEYLLGRLAALQGNASIAKQHYGSAIKRVEYILDNLAYDQRPAFLQSTWAVYEDMIALCLHEQQAERAFRYLEQARSLA